MYSCYTPSFNDCFCNYGYRCNCGSSYSFGSGFSGTNLLNNYFLAAFGLGYNGLNLGYNYASGVASNAIPVISGTTTTAVTGTGIGTISGNTATYNGQTLVNHCQ